MMVLFLWDLYDVIKVSYDEWGDTIPNGGIAQDLCCICATRFWTQNHYLGSMCTE